MHCVTLCHSYLFLDPDWHDHPCMTTALPPFYIVVMLWCVEFDCYVKLVFIFYYTLSCWKKNRIVLFLGVLGPILWHVRSGIAWNDFCIDIWRGVMCWRYVGQDPRVYGHGWRLLTVSMDLRPCKLTHQEAAAKLAKGGGAEFWCVLLPCLGNRKKYPACEKFVAVASTVCDPASLRKRATI